MGDLAPLAVAIPLVAAAILVAVAALVPRRVVDALACAASIACVVLCALVLDDASDGTLVHWFGGWTPRGGTALGISFAIDPIGAGLALFASVLFLAAFVFCWRYFIVIGPLFHALMLVFLAAMLGFSYTGDLFNLFVFFELLSVAAYALVAYDIEEEGPLQGALNFAVTNTHRRLLHPHRDRAAVRAHGCAQHGPDRRGPGGAAGRRSRRRGVHADGRRLLREGRRGAVPLLARRRVLGRPHPGLPAAFGGDERARAVRVRPRLLDGVLGHARRRGGARGGSDRGGHADGAGGRSDVLRPAPSQADAGVRDGQPRGPVPHRNRAARRRRAGRHRALRRGRRTRSRRPCSWESAVSSTCSGAWTSSASTGGRARCASPAR